MTGLSEFEKLFGSITILNVIEFALAIIFMVLIFTKVKDYIVVRHDAAKLKDEQLKTALEAVSHYPEYRAQSIKVQKELEEKIEELKRSQDANTERLKIMEESQKKLERNKLRDRILQSYRYFTDKDREKLLQFPKDEAIKLITNEDAKKYINYAKSTYGVRYFELYDEKFPNWMNYAE